MSRLVAAISLAAAALFPSAAAADREATSAPPAARFEGTNLTFAKVLAKAKASKRLVLIDVVRPDCPWCTALERDTFSDPRVAKAVEGLVLVRYDAESEGGRGVAQRYRVRGFPTLVVVDAAGAEVDRLVGFSPPEKFLAEIERIRKGDGTLPALAAAHEKAPDDARAAVAYARKLGRAGDDAAALALLDEVVAKGAAGTEGRLAAHSARAEIALEKGDSEGALAAYAAVVAEAPKSDAADDARVARVRLLAAQGSFPRALEEAEKARGAVSDPARIAAVEQVVFKVQRAAAERALVRWGESAADANDAAALHAAARAALESGLALGSALRWAERAADLSKRAPEVLDTWARLHAALLAFDSALARGKEALAGRLADPAREALASAVARWESFLTAPEAPRAPTVGADASPAAAGAPAAPSPAAREATPAAGGAPRAGPAGPEPADPCPPGAPPAPPVSAVQPDPCPPQRPSAEASR